MVRSRLLGIRQIFLVNSLTYYDKIGKKDFTLLLSVYFEFWQLDTCLWARNSTQARVRKLYEFHTIELSGYTEIQTCLYWDFKLVLDNEISNSFSKIRSSHFLQTLNPTFKTIFFIFDECWILNLVFQNRFQFSV